MRFFIFTLLIALFSCSVYAQKKVKSEDITLKTETGELQGTLLQPKGKSMPVVLFISGSGPTDRDGNQVMANSNCLKMLAEGLYRKGIASVRYDKRGVGGSAGAAIAEKDLRFDHFVEDAMAWIEKLKEEKKFSHVIVAGHSEGSLIGMIACKKSHADGFISISGVGETADKVLRKQLAGQPDYVKDEAYPILDSLVAGSMVDEVSPMLFTLFRPSVQPYLMSWFDRDPTYELSLMGITPVMIVQGKQDLQVGVEQAEILKKASPSAKYVVVDDMNHVLKEVGTDQQKNIASYNDPEMPVSETVIDEMAEFIYEGFNYSFE